MAKREACRDCGGRAKVPITGRDKPQPTGHVTVNGVPVGLTRDPDGEWTIWEGRTTAQAGFGTKALAMGYVRSTYETRASHDRTFG